MMSLCPANGQLGLSLFVWLAMQSAHNFYCTGFLLAVFSSITFQPQPRAGILDGRDELEYDHNNKIKCSTCELLGKAAFFFRNKKAKNEEPPENICDGLAISKCDILLLRLWLLFLLFFFCMFLFQYSLFWIWYAVLLPLPLLLLLYFLVIQRMT